MFDLKRHKDGVRPTVERHAQSDHGSGQVLHALNHCGVREGVAVISGSGALYCRRAHLLQLARSIRRLRSLAPDGREKNEAEQKGSHVGLKPH
jgi:hypothetical protein